MQVYHLTWGARGGGAQRALESARAGAHQAATGHEIETVSVEAQAGQSACGGDLDHGVWFQNWIARVTPG